MSWYRFNAKMTPQWETLCHRSYHKVGISLPVIILILIGSVNRIQILICPYCCLPHADLKKQRRGIWWMAPVILIYQTVLYNQCQWGTQREGNTEIKSSAHWDLSVPLRLRNRSQSVSQSVTSIILNSIRRPWTRAAQSSQLLLWDWRIH